MLSRLMFACWLAVLGWMIHTDVQNKKADATVNVGVQPCLRLVNHKPFPIFVTASAIQVDSAIRYVGFAPPEDSATMQLPYGDTTIKLTFTGPKNALNVYLYVDAAKCYRMVIALGDTTSKAPNAVPMEHP